MLRIVVALVAAGLSSVASLVRAQICTPSVVSSLRSRTRPSAIDVPASDGFCTNIQWMFNRGVTFGCTGNQYCPANPVRRDQMAAFIFRLAHDVVFQDGGNAFGNPAVLGTTDNEPLDLRANGSRVMRYEPNAISPNVIGGSAANSVTAGVRGATIAGGGVPAGADPIFGGEAPNAVTDAYGTVGGGHGNRAGDGAGTTTDKPFATVGGGALNTASGSSSTVAGGVNNTAIATTSTVAGGQTTRRAAPRAPSPGASTTRRAGPTAPSPGAQATRRAASSALSPGATATRRAATSALPRANRRMRTPAGASCGGTTAPPTQVECADRRQVRRAGAWRRVLFLLPAIPTPPTTACIWLPALPHWTMASDRRLKENLHAVDTRDVLDRLLALPIATWNLKSQDPSIRHMGAMAQDFRAAFGLGETELGISTLDADGVALAAIQGLNAKLEAKIGEQRVRSPSSRARLQRCSSGKPDADRRIASDGQDRLRLRAGRPRRQDAARARRVRLGRVAATT